MATIPSQYLFASDNHKHTIAHMPSAGIFWDIENLQVPYNRSVCALVKRFRDYGYNKGFREAEFVVVCDTSKVNPQILDDLNSSQVTVIHVSAAAKNAADDKLKHQIKHFVDIHGYNSVLLVISDDINFAPVLSDYKNSYRVHITLIQRQASDHLKSAANLVENFDAFCEQLPHRNGNQYRETLVMVSNLPSDRSIPEIKKELARLSTNCGGKKIFINKTKGEVTSSATITFGCVEDGRRGQQRLNGTRLFGRMIVAKLEIIRGTIESNSDSSENSADEVTHPVRYTSLNRQRCDSNISDVQPKDPTFCRRLPARDNSLEHHLQLVNFKKQVLPNVHISLQVLSARVHHLLDTHGGSLPLKSFFQCYVKEFHELFNTSDSPLVSLDHLITCVPGVSITSAHNSGIKRISWIPNRDRYLDNESVCSEPIGHRNNERWYGSQISQFGKEVRELLKSHSGATIPFNKFVPSYHTHFVRQLCVQTYGCFKLSELLDEIPHIVQVYGENDHRMITLTHREQTKRFATDLLKVLKAQEGRRTKLSELPAAYQTVFERPFDISDYGVCFLDDILRDVWEGTVIITPFGTDDKWIELPKRERTKEQKRRTEIFSQDVIELLRHSREIIDFQTSFARFIPCFHRYFDRQCRVHDFGFSKLIELLEEISPKVIEITANEEFGEKQLRLSYDNRLKALHYRLESILRHSTSVPKMSTISKLESDYLRIFKHNIDYPEYCANDLIDLIEKFDTNKLRVIQTKSELKVMLLDHHLYPSNKQIVRILMEEIDCELDVSQLEIRYLQECGESLNPDLLTESLVNCFVVDQTSKRVRLTEMFRLCRDTILCIQPFFRPISVEELDRELQHKYGRPLPQPNFFACKSVCELFGKFSDFIVADKSKKRFTFFGLTKELQDRPLVVRPRSYQILKRPGPKSTPKVEDMLMDNIPDSVALPDLVPQNQERDLIRLNSPEPSQPLDNLIDLSSRPSSPEAGNTSWTADESIGSHETVVAEPSRSTSAPPEQQPKTKGRRVSRMIALRGVIGFDSEPNQTNIWQQKRI